MSETATASGSIAAAAASSPVNDSDELVGPFTDILQQVSTVVVDTVTANVPRDLHWQSILLTLALAVTIFLFRRGRGARGADGRERQAGLLEYLLPRDIYTHVSARVDIGLYVLERILRPLWAVALIATVAPATEQFVIAGMQTVFGATPALESSLSWMLLYSAAALLGYDFVFYCIHYTMHKVPAMWAIHKVHHSAEVLTPLTRYREHFIAGPIWAAGAGIGYGVPAGMFAYLFDGGITQATIINISVFTLLFGFNGAFRHYHVSFRYPRWLEKWIQSPGMHHTHHSYLPQHWDTNLAAVTSIWDRMFGTLYVPEPDEYTPWGIGPETQAQYRSFWQNTSGPFRDWYRMLQAGRQPLASNAKRETGGTRT